MPCCLAPFQSSSRSINRDIFIFLDPPIASLPSPSPSSTRPYLYIPFYSLASSSLLLKLLAKFQVSPRYTLVLPASAYSEARTREAKLGSGGPESPTSFSDIQPMHLFSSPFRGRILSINLQLKSPTSSSWPPLPPPSSSCCLRRRRPPRSWTGRGCRQARRTGPAARGTCWWPAPAARAGCPGARPPSPPSPRSSPARSGGACPSALWGRRSRWKGEGRKMWWLLLGKEDGLI